MAVVATYKVGGVVVRIHDGSLVEQDEKAKVLLAVASIIEDETKGQ